MILELILLMNMIRTTPLQLSVVLTNIAQERVEYLCNNPFSHNGWGKYQSKFSYRGENLAEGYTNAKDVEEAFLNSPTHKKVILNENYKYVGIAEKCGIVVEEFGGYSK